MTLPDWHRKAPKPTPKRGLWAKKTEPARDPNSLAVLPIYDQYEPPTEDEVPARFRCIEAPDAGLRRMLSNYAPKLLTK